MSKFKSAIYKILCNDASGLLIEKIYRDKVPDMRWPEYKFDTTGSGMRRSIVASIFWGFYEGAEIRFIEKYFKGDTDVIELGASSGIISAHILSKMQAGKTLVSVEANSRLAAVWRVNSGRHNMHNAGTVLLNKAIHYEAGTVLFGVSDNTTESRLLGNDDNAEKAERIPAVKLQSVVDDYKMHDYSLFCDIEGAEIEILIHDRYALEKCRNIFIELHESSYKGKAYHPDALRDIITNIGFRLVAQYGYVYYFTRKTDSPA